MSPVAQWGRCVNPFVAGLIRPVLVAGLLATFLTMAYGAHHNPLLAVGRVLIIAGGLMLSIRHPEWLFEA